MYIYILVIFPSPGCFSPCFDNAPYLHCCCIHHLAEWTPDGPSDLKIEDG